MPFTPTLYIDFVFQKHALYVVAKDNIATFNLEKYGYFIDQELIPGRNHLLRDDGPIRDIRLFIKEQLSRKEYILWKIMWYEVRATMIADRPLDNFGIMHLIHFAEQCNARRCDVYFDNTNGITNIPAYVRDFAQRSGNKDLVGSSHDPKSPGYYYKVRDNSIELGWAKAVDEHGEIIK